MANILVVYESRAGQTRKIGEFVAARIRSCGHAVETVNLGAADGAAIVDMPDGIIIAAPVHGGLHSDRMASFVERHRILLDELPTAFLSVSLAALRRGAPEALAQVNRFIADTGWRPTLARPVAGALAYTRYNPAQRLLMRLIASRRELPTDTSQDYEYTDWDDLRYFVSGFLGRVQLARHRRLAVRTA